jgi:DNA-directed RNA polymerase specialized sigma24 family protein
VERDEAVARLPDAYQRVLAWLDAGWSDEQIAAQLGIEPEAVRPLVELARSKLARQVDAPTDASSDASTDASADAASATAEEPGRP